jgi:ATP-dependent RNA helicase RhlE
VKVKILISAQRLTGTIKWYDREKGFGFLTPDSGGRDVFIHRSALGRELQTHVEPGDRVVFGVEQRKKGPSALNIIPLDDAREDRARHDERVLEVRQPAPGGISFDNLNLMPELLRAVDEAGYVEPTPVQAQAIPPILAGKDLLGCAQTGTGKTAAFALPILQRLSAGTNGRSKRPVRALVLAPTRELAVQIDDSFRTYGRFTGLTTVVIYGGVSQGPQVDALRRGVDIVIATPGRLLDLMGQGHVKLDRVETLVLDEADRMLDMGFIHDVKRIVGATQSDRQTLLFSATIPKEIVELGNSIQRNAVEVSVTPDQPTVDAIEQAVYFVPKDEKQALLEHVLADPEVTRALVFTRTKHGANRVVKKLVGKGIQAEPIHGNKSQTARQRALKNFRKGKTRVLVATDVASRGIDVDDISHVIQYDLSNEPETYVHRIGRTGRAGANGIALAFCADHERAYLRDIEKLIQMHVSVIRDLPRL